MTRVLVSTAAALLVAFLAQDALAQAVQLPSFHYFTVSTTVSVPDRGAAYLGGVSRAASGRVSRGVPLLGKAPGLGRLGRNDAIGSSIGTSGVSVSATIIDHRELDEAVLAEARARRGGAPLTEAVSDAPPRDRLPAAAPVASVADIRRQNEIEDDAQQQEALALVAKGRQAEAAGKLSVARVYYEMAARRADEDLRRKIAEHMAKLAQQHRMAAAKP
jgi:type II secretory pathway component GspD/PulD (secretin)